MKKDYRWFDVEWPSGYKPGDWISVVGSRPTPLRYPFDIKLCYSDAGELLCAGLRIGEGAVEGLKRFPPPVPTGTYPPGDYSGMGVVQKPKENITARLLAQIPLGAVLKFIQERGVTDATTRENLQRLDLPIAVPFEGLPATPGAKRRDDFYVEQAERFAAIYAELLEAGLVSEAKGSTEAYNRLAKMTGWAVPTVRVQVRTGWTLRPDLRPKGIRGRRTKKEES